MRPLPELFSFLTGNGSLIEVTLSFFAVFVILALVFPIHECAHGYMAKFLGDDTAERQGRLTLNPLAHLDPLGAFVMLLLPIGWAKPVEVNYSKCHKVKGKTAMALIAAAGPLSNLLAAYVFMIILKIFSYSLDGTTGVGMYLPIALGYIIQISIFLAVLNLFPIPPFDGSKILFAYLHPRTVFKIMQHQQIISIGFLLLFFTGIIMPIFTAISSFVFNILSFLTFYIDLIFK